jgi:phosphoenolpyruvate carboxykinase (ATP)
VAIPTAVEGVPNEILVPKNTWADKDGFDATAQKLARMFAANFQKYESHASAAVKAAGPQI